LQAPFSLVPVLAGAVDAGADVADVRRNAGQSAAFARAREHVGAGVDDGNAARFYALLVTLVALLPARR
jgi:hypothetical protein